ncbi:MAG: hypothetical protein C3F08_03260 [Candidatus Methylomirabilota bacterium]|nr:MAG: hypothetical protein C3F08_03260 [candidate division NC10 bacterium]
MRRIVVRAPTCSADIVIFLKHALRTHTEELQPGEQAAFVFDAERFSFSVAIFESLLAGVGLQLLSSRDEDGIRVFEVQKPHRESA